MEHIQLQLNMLSLGHLSPVVITPRGLKKLLIEIESHLPEFLKLPYDPKGNIWKFYQTLTCSTVLHKGRFLVIVSIPLLDKINKFEIYDVFNMPVAHDKTPNMVASYMSEAISIAVNLAETKYVLLNDRDQKHCIFPLRCYCDIRSPLYSIAPSKLCIIALFLKDKERMMKNCDSVVRPKTNLSKASHIVDGIWFVATPHILTFAAVCPDKRRETLIVHSSLGIIKLNISCAASSSYLTLLPYYHNESKSDIQDHFIEELKNYNGSQIQIWKPFISAIPNFTKK